MGADSGEIDQCSGVKSITIPLIAIGAKRR
jgi:hypothetical protein